MHKLVQIKPSLVSLFYFIPIRLHTSVTLWKCPIQYLLPILHYHLTAICIVHEGNEDKANVRLKAVYEWNAFIQFV